MLQRTLGVTRTVDHRLTSKPTSRHLDGKEFFIFFNTTIFSFFTYQAQYHYVSNFRPIKTNPAQIQNKYRVSSSLLLPYKKPLLLFSITFSHFNFQPHTLFESQIHLYQFSSLQLKFFFSDFFFISLLFLIFFFPFL